MQVPVLIQRLPDDQGYEARAGEPFGVRARAGGKAEAVRLLTQLIRQQLEGDSEVMLLDVAPPAVPQYFDTLDPNDPDVQEWKRQVELYRQECDEQPEPPWTDAGDAA